MSIWQPDWAGKLFPTKRHYQTHISHVLVVLVLFAGNGYWVGAALPLMNGWEGYQLGGLLGLAFYLLREIAAHLDYRDMRKHNEITAAEYKLHLWDSRVDFLLPLAITLPVIGHEHDIWTLTGLVWAVCILHYIKRPPGYAGGMRA